MTKSTTHKDAVKSTPRGDDAAKNTPEPTGAPVTLPSQKRPYVPSDEIHEQIEASDAKTKAPGEGFERKTQETVKDYAIRLGIDGNDGLSEDEIMAKIAKFQGKRMFANEKGNLENTKSDETKAHKELDEKQKAIEEDKA